MKRLITLVWIMLLVQGQSPGQGVDYTWWNTLHGWQAGDPGWRHWIILSPGYLGPNALPVPGVKRGLIETEAEFELSGTYHFHPGDPTQDLSGRVLLPFSGGKIALELYGVLVEHFAFSEDIRNERFSRIEDGKGFATGDLYITTLVQLARDRRFPNTLLRLALRTASGGPLEGARYTDSPGYFFDLSFSKDFRLGQGVILRPFGLAGFYSWQTNDDHNQQNDAPLYALGAELEREATRLSVSLSGYSGYKDQHDQPNQLNLELRREMERLALGLQYIQGLRHQEYRSLRFSLIFRMKAP